MQHTPPTSNMKTVVCLLLLSLHAASGFTPLVGQTTAVSPSTVEHFASPLFHENESDEERELSVIVDVRDSNGFAF